MSWGRKVVENHIMAREERADASETRTTKAIHHTTAASKRRPRQQQRPSRRSNYTIIIPWTARLLLIMTAATTTTTTTHQAHGLAVPKKGAGGGRAPGNVDKIDPHPQGDDHDDHNANWFLTPCANDECRLVILQITDVYTLEHLASFKTLVDQTKERCRGATVVSMLTGDFLSPYLLASVDRGAGMMNALNSIPLDYLTWGNHEADIAHKTVCRHVRNFQGTWINSNMLDHDAMDAQQEYEIIQVPSPDGSRTRKIGLVAVLSDDPDLYSHFKAPGAFGGATITNPWEALTKYQKQLQKETDMIIPLQHLYVPDDHKTCREFDFPVILSGHDHHKVDEVVDGTRLLKPGMNAAYATVLEISWKGKAKPDDKPTIRAQFVECDQWEAEPKLREQNERAYDVLEPLRNTELARVPNAFEPLSSNGARESVCTMGKYICTLLKSSLNMSRRQRRHAVEAVLLMGGNIRGNTDYEAGSFFSLEALEEEINSDEVIGLVNMPGWLLEQAIVETHAGDPIPGWLQYDQGVQQDDSGRVTHVGGQPIDNLKNYRVATKISDLTNGQSPSLTEFYTAHKDWLPPKGAYVNIQTELMGYFARNLWRKIWDAISMRMQEECPITSSDCEPEERIKYLDRTGDGEVSVEEIQQALRDMLGYSVDDRELTLAQFVHAHADVTNSGSITLADLEVFCGEMEELYVRDSWRLNSKRASFPAARTPEEIARAIEFAKEKEALANK